MEGARQGVERIEAYQHPGRVVLQRLVDMTRTFVKQHDRQMPHTYPVNAEEYHQLYAYGALWAMSHDPLVELFTKDGTLVLWGVVVRIDEGSPSYGPGPDGGVATSRKHDHER